MGFTGDIQKIINTQGAAGSPAVVDIPGLDVKRKELSSHPALLHAFDACAIRSRRGATEIVVVVSHWRGHVVVRINDDSVALDLECSPPEFFVTLLRR